MKIRTWANLSLIVVVTLMSSLVLWTWWTQQQTIEFRRTIERLDNLAANVSNLDNLADEYQHSEAERPKQQWYKQHQEVVANLEWFVSHSDNPILSLVKSDTVLVRDMFDDLVEHHLSADATEELANNQFRLRLRTIIRHLAVWRGNVREKGEEVELLLTRLSIANVICWTLFIVFNSYLLRSRIITPMSRLQKSAAIIGAGHLEHRTGISTNDEIGDLSRSIDLMSEQLQRITTSRDNLEREIQQRLLVEAELETQHQHLLKLVESSEAANRAKSVFLANMSHELRTPMNAILGFSELMAQDETMSAKQKESLDIINRSGQHLLAMINDVLDISKIEAGRLELDVQAFDLLKLLHDISDMIKVRAANKQLAFYLEMIPTVPQYIRTDSGKVRQVLINLLGNAIKFTKQGQIILRCQALPLSTTQVSLEIEVIDSGMGIPAEQLNNLFKPFVQLARIDTGLEGTGLGLTISKSLVELMGGKISVSSVLNVGSTFKVALPVAIANADELSVEAPTHLVKSLAPHQPVWRLLVVDDNLDNRLLLATMLSQVGFQVRQANNGQEAIEKFLQWQPHLIWMDMRMPVLDGYQATAKIRQMPGGQQVKIIAITASAFREQLNDIFNAGCDAVIHKPFQAAEVFAALTRYLEVKFIYQDNPISTSSSTQELTFEMLNELPLELRQQLHTAALNLDIDETDEVISQIRQLTPEIADKLQKMAQSFQFERIIQLTELKS